MAKQYIIKLEENDLGQLLDGLDSRCEAWIKTADYLRIGGFADGEVFVIEECDSQEEAEGIAAHYQSIIDSIRKRRAEQS